MKSEKGITIISLIIYVIVLSIVIGMVAIISGAFMDSVDEADMHTDPIEQYTTFNSYFSEEVNHPGLEVVQCEDDYILFSNGVQYSFISENRGIYKNKVKICRNIDFCSFSRELRKKRKTVIIVEFSIDGQTRKTNYTLK